MQIKNILIPTDFSAISENALAYAQNLAEVINAKIVLLHVSHIPITANYTLVDIPSNELLERNEAEGKSQLAKFKSQYSRISETIQEMGLLTDSIQDHINENNIDLVIIGTEGAQNLEEELLGTHASHIVSKVNIPILTIPASFSTKNLKNILFTTNFEKEDSYALSSLALFTLPFDSTIHVVHIGNNSKTNQEKLNLLAQKIVDNVGIKKISYEIIPGEDNVADELLDLINLKSYDMLCMVKSHKNIFERIFKESTTEELTLHSNIPLFIY